jgi:hypothetical protein
MSKVNGKQKGNKFERDIANKFSDIFAEYTGIEKAFRRNPDSGSFFGGSNVDRKDIYDTEWAIYGDLICPRNFNFTVECKHYKSAPILNAILTENVSEWDDWIGQARQDAEACGKIMLIVLKYNRTQTLTITEKDTIIDEPIILYKDTEIHLLEDVLKIDPEPFFFTPKQES